MATATALPLPQPKMEREATIEDLYEVDEKAEIIDGRIVRFMASGFMPSYAAMVISSRLFAYATEKRTGYAFGDNTGFAVILPNRKSFSPDAAFYTGLPTGMRFLNGAPLFAVEVRSENDYGPQAERDILAKIADYFAAQTQVVWDVDLLNPDAVVKKYVANVPNNPTIYARHEIADALPALPDWSLPVADLFAPAPPQTAL